MGMNMQGRPTRPNETSSTPPAPRFGPKGLLQDEPLIFELDGWDRTGVDLPEPEGAPSDDLSGLLRDAPIGLPGLSEPETVRHYVRLSQMNHAIDLALYPLGSCTMNSSASRLSHTWLPVVMTSTPMLSSASPHSRVIPAPAAEFSPLAITKSTP